jgi:mannose-6-phosphate isomerase
VLQLNMKTLNPRPYLLENPIQHYSWGTRGVKAVIPNLLGIEPENDVPYAELWIGAHPNSPSNVVMDGARIPLPELIRSHPLDILGDLYKQAFSMDFPFLLKVLSVAEPLSIQAHPNKNQARILRARDPEHYPDDNHKPEIAIALDELTLLAGFKPLPEMEQTLGKYPEILDFIGADSKQALLDLGKQAPLNQQAYYRNLFPILLRKSDSNQADMTRSIAGLANRCAHASVDLTKEERIFVELQTRYPEDVGLFFVFLLNFMRLEKGQGIFIAPGIPHAYLQGNIVECMASSDNVVRLGLTPKFKDYESLIEILDYDHDAIPVLEGEFMHGERVYRTPAKEFMVSSLVLDPGKAKTQECENIPEIILITDGEIQVSWKDDEQIQSQYFHQGQAILIPASLEHYEIHSGARAEIFRVTVPKPGS